jgi:hypothetical protein
MYVIKEEVDHFEEKFAKIIQIFLPRGKTWIRILCNYVGSGSDLAKQYRLRTDPDPQSCPNMHIHLNSTVHMAVSSGRGGALQRSELSVEMFQRKF